MNILQKVSLKEYSTMRLGGIAQYLVEVSNKQELEEAINWAAGEDLKIIMIGRGSNIIWRDEGFQGLIIVNRIMGFETSDTTQDTLVLNIGSGENWDSVVERATQLEFSGIESLSLIPGTAGATPIQNVGAYGAEISSVLVSVEAYDLLEKEFVVIPESECDFGYRSSRFKTKDRARFLIVAITLQLSKKLPEPPYYEAVQSYINTHKIDQLTPAILRDIIIDIRESKLPDPEIVANCGSFFKNPVVSSDKFSSLRKNFPIIPYWEVDKTSFKLSAAWLIDQVGYKAINDPETGISTWPTQSLVLVNSSAKTTSDLLKFSSKLIKKVEMKFGVKLVQEPEMLP